MDKGSLVNILNNYIKGKGQLYELIPLIYEYLEENSIEKHRISTFIDYINNSPEHQLNSSIIKIIDHCVKHYLKKYEVFVLHNLQNKPILYY